MGLISALVALLKAVPSLERLCLQISDAVREANAKKRYDAKVDRIDALVDGVRAQHTTIEQRGSSDENEGVQESSIRQPRLDERSAKDSS